MRRSKPLKRKRPLRQRTALRRSAPIKRTTSLRRSGPIKISAATRKRMQLDPKIREQVMAEQQVCPVCYNGFEPDQHQEIHHVHERSSIRLKKVRDQIWNLVRLHNDPRYEGRSGERLLCHDVAHEDSDVRLGLEDTVLSDLRGLIVKVGWQDDIEQALGQPLWEVSGKRVIRAYELKWIAEFGKK